MQVYSH